VPRPKAVRCPNCGVLTVPTAGTTSVPGTLDEVAAAVCENCRHPVYPDRLKMPPDQRRVDTERGDPRPTNKA
jgi:phage terminase large subunit GpA-like protein